MFFQCSQLKHSILKLISCIKVAKSETANLFWPTPVWIGREPFLKRLANCQPIYFILEIDRPYHRLSFSPWGYIQKPVESTWQATWLYGQKFFLGNLSRYISLKTSLKTKSFSWRNYCSKANRFRVIPSYSLNKTASNKQYKYTFYNIFVIKKNILLQKIWLLLNSKFHSVL